MCLVKTSYSDHDVTVLLKDLTGYVNETDTLEREKLIQQGNHYSEFLPKEYVPTERYMYIYNALLDTLSEETAYLIKRLSEKLYARHGSDLVLVSLARAGTPIGILIKRFFKFQYDLDVPHYTISIIRGKGIDSNAVKKIISQHKATDIQFVDGWVGKGAINKELTLSVNELTDSDNLYAGLSHTLAVLSDPSYTTDLCATHQDFLIPSACLNATVSGLFSRTIHRSDLIGADDYHGSVYYGELIDVDHSIKFIETVAGYFGSVREFPELDKVNALNGLRGIDEVIALANEFGVADINMIKPGVGETTRVLLRRLPWKVLINFKTANQKYLSHILQLCKDKNIEVINYPLKGYSVCGLIKNISDL